MQKKLLFLGYPPCSTCQKAAKWLKEQGIDLPMRNIKTENPNPKELAKWYKLSKLPLKKFFNTSGLSYRELGLKDKLASMSDEEQLELLAGDGMLVKRPLLIGKDFVLTGFREAEWRDKLL